MKWTDSRDIAIALLEKFPDQDPKAINFVDLRNWVLALPGFDDDPKRSGEKILGSDPDGLDRRGGVGAGAVRSLVAHGGSSSSSPAPENTTSRSSAREEETLAGAAHAAPSAPRSSLKVRARRRQHAVDRIALLRAAGEVDAAQLQRLVVHLRAEGLREEFADQRPHGVELLREAVDRGAPLQVALLVQPRQHLGAQALFERA